MKKLFLVGLALMLVFSAGGCFGPQKLTRMLDDWANETYVNSPWPTQILFYVGVYGIGYWFANIVDWFVLNPIDFWTKSAWSGKGTAYEHPPTPGAKK